VEENRAKVIKAIRQFDTSRDLLLEIHDISAAAKRQIKPLKRKKTRTATTSASKSKKAQETGGSLLQSVGDKTDLILQQSYYKEIAGDLKPSETKSIMSQTQCMLYLASSPL
jgi:hypothetical protein